MAKKNKTRQQKVASDIRLTRSTPMTYSLPTVSRTPQANIQTDSYFFVQKDLIHTLIVTASVIAGEVVLFFLLRSHI